MLEASRPYLLRILGPNCVGLLVPGLGLNASFAHTSPLPGRLAFVSQSGGLTTAALDWARSRKIGFSHFVSIGEAADVDFGDVLDWLASDPAPPLSCSTSNRSAPPASSCLRRAQRHAISQCSSSRPGAYQPVRARRPRTPVPSRRRTMSSMRPFGGRACCA